MKTESWLNGILRKNPSEMSSSSRQKVLRDLGLANNKKRTFCTFYKKIKYVFDVHMKI